MGAKPGYEAEPPHLEHPAEGLVRLALAIDLPNHRAARVRVQAAHGRLIDRGEVLEPDLRRRRRGSDRTDLDDVGAHLRTEGREERLAHRAARHARGGLARGGPLEDVAHVGLPVLLRTHEIGVPGSGQMHLGDLLRNGKGIHALLPVGVVAVAYLQRDRPSSVRP